jgi:4'-phosphopantetheinyl transferase
MVDQWCSPPHPLPALLHDEIHVWRASLHAPAAEVDALAGTLSMDEQARAQQLCFARDQRRFVVGRGLLRTILGRYLHVDPHALRFCYGANGKPALAAMPDGEEWQFNVSHSHGLVLVAVTRCRQIGVDLERVRAVANMMEIAQRICSPRERAMLVACSPNEKRAAFFRCWTGKEAYVKATGAGLAQPLHQIEVAAWAGARRLCIAGPVAGTVRWSLQNINPAPGYVAALVVEGQAGSLYGWQWPHWF